MSECANYRGEVIQQMDGVGFKGREEASRGGAAAAESV